MTGIIRRRNADHDAAVGVAFVARILAHAVGDDAFRLGGRRYHGAARTHAEAVDRTAVGGMMHQLVVRRAEDGWPALGPKRHLSISDCGCSARKPMENGLASM